MADNKRNTTQKDKDRGKVIEEGMPRCKNCLSRMSILEIGGIQKLWCYICDAQRLNTR